MSSFLFPKIIPDDLLTKDYDCIGDRLSSEQIGKYIENEIKVIKKDPSLVFARDNFKNDDGSPWLMSPGELAIFKMILFRQHPRCQIVSCTQYGKSITVARAVLSRITTFPDEFMLVVPDTKRGRIIIRYILADTANNEYFSNKLVGIKMTEANKLLLRLLEEKSKVRLTYQVIEEDESVKYGSVEILTTEAHRKQNAITSIMGFGGRNIINEESSLIDDEIDAGVFRMMAGKGEDTFLLKIGNPFFRNHFRKTWQDDNYKKIYIDYRIALAEGRYTPDFIEEARQKPQFEILYECRFPSAESADREGWVQLLTEEEVKLAIQPGVHFGEERMGADPADEGTNESALIKRSMGYAEVLFAQAGIDPMAFTGITVQNTMETKQKRVYIDRIGVGAGVYSRAIEVNRTEQKNKMMITGVNSAEKPQDESRFANRRAEMMWRTREWIKSGGKLSNNKRWYQLAEVRYKPNSRGQIQIMSKDEMRKRGITSLDVADGLALTFYDGPNIIRISDEDRFFYRKMRENERKGLKFKPGATIGRPR